MATTHKARISELDAATPLVPTPADLRAWRAREGLSAKKAAKLAGVDLRTWQRWELSEVAAPQWLRDTLRQRYGSAP